MDENRRREAVREHVKKKFGGKKQLPSKVRPVYPEGMEREYLRVSNAYMMLLSKVIREELVPEIRKAANAELEPGYFRMDDAGGLIRRLTEIFAKCGEDLEQKTRSFDLYQRISYVASLTTKLSVREWKRMVKETVGLDLMDDYYAGEFYRQILDVWTKANVDLIKTVPNDALGRMRDIVIDGYRNGRTTTSMVKEIQKVYGMSRRHARLIARDQIAKLNSEITRHQQEDAGVTEYIWSSSHDQRVRERHQELDGKKFSWDDPPEVAPGRRCHPGEDYQCRCCALPVFDIDTLEL